MLDVEISLPRAHTFLFHHTHSFPPSLSLFRSLCFGGNESNTKTALAASSWWCREEKRREENEDARVQWTREEHTCGRERADAEDVLCVCSQAAT